MRLTARGEKVFIALLAIGITAFLVVVYHLSTHLHFTGEDYCYGSFSECFVGDE